jgi:hypothetical protein
MGVRVTDVQLQAFDERALRAAFAAGAGDAEVRALRRRRRKRVCAQGRAEAGGRFSVTPGLEKIPGGGVVGCARTLPATNFLSKSPFQTTCWHEQGADEVIRR